MSKPIRFGVIVFPGSNCDRDVAYVTQTLLNQPTRMVWHEDSNVSDLDVIVVPGGFSYGDYLRCGAIARFSPAMQSTLEHAKQGKPVLGICNGFQVLTEAGLLPGALVRNRDLHFICDQVPLKVERTDLLWTQHYQPGRWLQFRSRMGKVVTMLMLIPWQNWKPTIKWCSVTALPMAKLSHP